MSEKKICHLVLCSTDGQTDGGWETGGLRHVSLSVLFPSSLQVWLLFYPSSFLCLPSTHKHTHAQSVFYFIHSDCFLNSLELHGVVGIAADVDVREALAPILRASGSPTARRTSAEGGGPRAAPPRRAEREGK